MRGKLTCLHKLAAVFHKIQGLFYRSRSRHHDHSNAGHSSLSHIQTLESRQSIFKYTSPAGVDFIKASRPNLNHKTP